MSIMSSRLQAELKQTKPFARRTSEALLSVLRTAALLEHQVNEALRPFGITELQYNVLRILRGAGPDGLCGREIAERLVSKVPDVSRLLDRMDRSSRYRKPSARRWRGQSSEHICANRNTCPDSSRDWCGVCRPI